MIKTFIDKLLGKGPNGVKAHPRGKRVEVGKDEHGIDPGLVDERAIRVVQTLSEAGYEAYIVGGAVRDLLLGLRPKDFDVATNATPEQVKALFRRAFIIGRRFRIVHVVFGRGREHEVIEVSTFRAMMDAAAADQVSGNEKTSRGDLQGKTHVVDAEGRVLRDNVWGPMIEDAARRDFTVNAMYYDPRREIVVDYHGGIKDSKKKLLRMIGDPETRYREDPVRIIRVVRFAAKLGFEIEPKTRAPLQTMAALLDNVPLSRMFDEMIKLLQTGHSLASIEELRKQGLHRGVFPVLDVALDEAHRHDGREKFVQLALADTDRRVNEGKPVAPSFMLACMLWHDVLDRWQQLKKAGEPAFPALQQAIDAVFDARIGDISGRGKLAADMREIWMMQPRFERRVGSGPSTLVEQPRFRAGFDFLRLRADAGEIDAELAEWWEKFSQADAEARHRMIEGARETGHARRVVRTIAEAAGAPSASDGDAVKNAVAGAASPWAPCQPTTRRPPPAAMPADAHAASADGRVVAAVGLGANLGDAQAVLKEAAAALGRLPATELMRMSPIYRSAPIGASGPDFFNAVALLRTALTPEALLAEMQRIESSHGRERPYPNAPRTLDLDLLLFGDRQIESAALIVPHPRMHERAFVLRPLTDVAPDALIPGRGKVAEWLLRVSGQRIEKVSP